MLEFKKVSKNFGSIKALEDISFNIEDGEFVFIIGPSGSGKTTLLNLIIHRFPPSAGEIVFNKQKIHSLKKKNIPSHRRNIGAVFQDYKLLPERTIRENVELALAIKKVHKKEWLERVNDVLSLVGLSERTDLFPSQLSGGELQRAALARALVVNPKLVFADEPTGNLDEITTSSIMNLLKKINEEGRTIIVATHDKSLIEKHATKVIELDKGKLTKITVKKKK